MREEGFKMQKESMDERVPLSDDIDLLQKQFAAHENSDELLQHLYDLKSASTLEKSAFGAPQWMSSEIILLGKRMGLSFYRILALVLKNLQERNDWENEDEGHDSDRDGLFLSEPALMRIYYLFEQSDGLAQKSGYHWPLFKTLVHEMITTRMHRVANNSPELHAFVERMKNSSDLLREGTDEEKETYLLMKNKWLHLQDELGNCLTLLEQRRLENANIRRAWMAEFGREYCTMQEQIKRLEGLQLKCDLLKADPGLSAEELEDLVMQAEKSRQSFLEKIRLEVQFSSIVKGCIRITAVDNGEFQKFRKNYKKILRKIWLVMHPDQLQNNPVYRRLTELQKEFLHQLWNELMEIRPEELGYAPEQVGYEHRDIERLEEILETAEKILANAGIDTNAWFIIQGDTLDEQVQWLQKASERLEREIELVKIELRILLEDKGMREKLAMIKGSADQKSLIKAEMQRRAQQAASDADHAQSEFAMLVSRGDRS